MNALSYYRAIARANAGDLARAAARRASRALRDTLAPPPVPPDERRLLAAFGIADRAALAQRIFVSRPGVVADARSVRAALEGAPGARARAIARAEAAAARRFRVFGIPVAFPAGLPIDWSLDAGCGRSFPLRPVGDPALLPPGMDPKYPWVLGRLDHAVALGQGFVASSDPAQRQRFAAAFVTQVSDFLLSNPVGQGIQWLMPMEVALRAANLAMALMLFAAAEAVRAPSFLLLVLRALSEHTLWVEQHLEDRGAVPNNHLIANHVGLLVVSALFPELPQASRQAALALGGLRAEIDHQVLPDGYSFEGSVPYHRLSLELFTLAFLAGSRNGFDFGARYLERLEKMFQVAAAYCSQRGLAPQVGDNDSGRALPFADRASLDHGYLAPFGAALFSEPTLKLHGATFPDEALWTLGEAGRWTFDQLQSHRSPAGFSSPEGGLHVLRAGEAVLTVCAGPKGQRGLGGHNHHDQLSFELHLGGAPVIVDPGTGQYTRDPGQRNVFRGTAAHNTLRVDERELGPMDPQRLFALFDDHPAEVTAFAPGGRLAWMDVRTAAYAPVSVMRSFFLDAQARALCVVDRLEGCGLHRVAARLHLPDVALSLRPASDAERWRARQVPFAPLTFAEQAFVLGPADAPRAVVLVEEGTSAREIPAPYSPGYGEVHEARAISLELERELPARAAWVVLFG